MNQHNSSSNMNDDDDDDDNAKKASNNNDDDDNISNEPGNMNIDSHSSSSNRNCLYCLQVVQGSSRCSKCRTALYCDRACQKKHWPVHKNICIDSNDAEDSNNKLFMKAENQRKQGNCIHIYIKQIALLI